MTHRAKNGFTLTEMLISVTFLGLLSSMMLPLINNQTGDEKLLAISQGAASELAFGYAKYASSNTVTATTRPVDFINQLNYVRIISDGSINVQTDTNGTCNLGAVGPCTKVDVPCDAAKPCALLQNGALLMYDSGAVFPGTTANTHGLKYFLDPDADGPLPGFTMVLYVNGRVTTQPYAAGAIYDANDFVMTTLVDPDYIREWVDG